ncbi:MAG: 50S ribosomal protein L10 [Armatimonadetes bacterium]|nr:50S ribosomal protein L10 [Armatimonadota bacterium]MDE2207960.1 50S ribosomal protein L10 [Armatimonadota bacterium]
MAQKKTRHARRRQKVAAGKEWLQQSKGLIFIDYRGLTVSEQETLGRRLRKHGSRFHVVKNTLFTRSLGEEQAGAFADFLKGPTAAVFLGDDAVGASKALLDFVREIRKPEIVVKAAWIEGKLLSPADVVRISKLPSRDQLVAELVGVLEAPIAEFVGVLDGIISEFVYTLDAIVSQKEAA